jgi:hypothetical protein
MITPFTPTHPQKKQLQIFMHNSQAAKVIGRDADDASDDHTLYLTTIIPKDFIEKE